MTKPCLEPLAQPTSPDYLETLDRRTEFSRSHLPEEAQKHETPITDNPPSSTTPNTEADPTDRDYLPPERERGTQCYGKWILATANTDDGNVKSVSNRRRNLRQPLGLDGCLTARPKAAHGALDFVKPLRGHHSIQKRTPTNEAHREWDEPGRCCCPPNYLWRLLFLLGAPAVLNILGKGTSPPPENIPAEVFDMLKDVDAAGKDGRTPLLMAIRLRMHDVVEILCNNFNANRLQADKYGVTPLHEACLLDCPDLEMVKILLICGPNDKDNNPHHDYSQLEYSNAVKLHRQLTVVNKLNWTPIHCAMLRGGDEVVTHLLSTLSSVTSWLSSTNGVSEIPSSDVLLSREGARKQGHNGNSIKRTVTQSPSPLIVGDRLNTVGEDGVEPCHKRSTQPRRASTGSDTLPMEPQRDGPGNCVIGDPVFGEHIPENHLSLLHIGITTSSPQVVRLLLAGENSALGDNWNTQLQQRFPPTALMDQKVVGTAGVKNSKPIKPLLQAEAPAPVVKPQSISTSPYTSSSYAAWVRAYTVYSGNSVKEKAATRRSSVDSKVENTTKERNTDPPQILLPSTKKQITPLMAAIGVCAVAHHTEVRKWRARSSETVETPLREVDAPTGIKLLASSYAIITEILKRDDSVALIDAQDADGNTALHHAVMTADPVPVALLLAKGSNQLLRNGAGLTAAALAEAILSSLAAYQTARRTKPFVASIRECLRLLQRCLECHRDTAALGEGAPVECNKCRLAVYCSPACRSAHYKKHKAKCSAKGAL